MDSYSSEPAGLLLIADGLSPVRAWDGLTANTEHAGIAAPTTAPTLAIVDSPGPILGEYRAFVRFRDKRGNISDLSPVSDPLTAQMSATLTVTDATNAAPIVITSAGHGLVTGTRVRIEEVEGNVAANNTWTVTVVDADSFSLDFSEGTGDYTEGGTVTVGVSGVAYSDVPVATGIGASKVTAREILRNTDGQLSTFYTDVVIADNAATTATSERDDDELSTQIAVPLFLPDGSPAANRHGVPPNFMRVVAHHLGRMFYLVNAEEKRGACIVQNGSDTVQGINTHWTEALAGRALYVTGASRFYEIASVDKAAQTLELTEDYDDASDAYATFAIKPMPGFRRVIFYSEPGLPESVLASNGIELQDDGTELTGAVTKGSFIYFVTDRTIYRHTFRVNPGIDGFSFLSVDRGGVNHRCILPVDESIYMLDQSGIHRFDGSESEPISQQIQAIFTPQQSDSGFRINWDAAEHFHAAHFPAEEQVRFFVCMTGQRLPRHALCYDYRGKSWEIEEYPAPVSASCTGNVQGHRRMFLGSEGKRVYLHGAGPLDGILPAAGTLRGRVTGASAFRLEDIEASFPQNLAGLPVYIASGKGQGQRRTIHASTGTELRLLEPWLVLPDATSVYQIAGVQYRWRSKWFRYVDSSDLEPRRVAVQYQPTRASSPLSLRIFEDYDDKPISWAATREADATEGFGSAGDDYLSADLSQKGGYAQQRIDGRRDQHLHGPRTMNVELSGVASEQVRLYGLEIDGVED